MFERVSRDAAWRAARLTAPEGSVEVILDTDTYNEVDDQFAVAHALLSPEKILLRAIHAAPFHNDRSSGPADGMEKSHAEILRLLEKMGIDPQRAPNAGAGGFLHKGSRAWLTDANTPRRRSYTAWHASARNCFEPRCQFYSHR